MGKRNQTEAETTLAAGAAVASERDDLPTMTVSFSDESQPAEPILPALAELIVDLAERNGTITPTTNAA